MHIPDGFLDPAVIIITYAVLVVYGFLAFRRIKKTLSPENVPLVSVLSASIFAAQMLNWPLPGGTSLHFVGGALAGIMLGPWLGFLTIFIVLTVQCLVFHDGGITALGANSLNMAVIDVLVGYVIYRFTIKTFKTKDSLRMVAAFLGGWLGIALAGIACGLEIGYSQAFPYGVSITVPIMAGWHAVLGVIEGFITALTVAYLRKRAPHIMFIER
ncbi:energy-coupling factor ABC transporter permease [Candidatus Bathyarchaeota archaeon]|nr:energy-coupling factor ABC transporter permease [Candidatus Bathyarchaeota archaeon]MBS7613526.1 energy-coupling factor ABC transporter permease [Candidatus Bathyarchaeota archaeon]MBS7617336.1 energy-coupling factor ABC transporter permease [Candidatus Bathyarchaeota archaeon]